MLKRKSGVYIPPSSRLKIVSLGVCRYCGCIPVYVTIDHIQPVSKGGTSTINNLTGACNSCNAMKGDKTIPEFREYLSEKIKKTSGRIHYIQSALSQNKYSPGYLSLLALEGPKLHKKFCYLNTIINSIDNGRYYG